MENLARNKDCDKQIARELKRSRIKAVKITRSAREVPASIIGKLGPFTFTRAWYYWAVEGQMPLSVAIELYKDPVGREDIRVDGHCGCPPPEQPWIKWIDPDGLKVLKLKEEQSFDKMIEKGHLSKDVKNEYVFSDNPEELGAHAYIEVYHVDSEVGLRLLADTIRKHGLDKVRQPNACALGYCHHDEH